MGEENLKLGGLDLIKQMLRSTHEGKIEWNRLDDIDRFEGKTRGARFSVEFIYLMRVEEAGCDRTIARLSAFNLMYDYAIGTEGFDLICEMLAQGDSAWMDARARGQHKLREAIRLLRELE